MTPEARASQEVTLLIVDDDDVDVMGIERGLKKLKILNPVVRARDGAEGLALLRDSSAVRRPYIVLLDINMPRMNGIEMLAELRNDSALTSSIVFVLTTSNADEDKVAAYRLHVSGYIVKSRAGEGFLQALELLDHYWRIVDFPNSV